MCLGIPGLVEEIINTEPMASSARVRFGGIQKVISIVFVPEVNVGDYVIVHVGFAISVVNEQEAKRVFRYLDEIGELEELNTPGKPE
mgnify:CR=1 FL=1